MIRIANGQGFWGDSLEAPVEQIRRGPIDYLTLLRRVMPPPPDEGRESTPSSIIIP